MSSAPTGTVLADSERTCPSLPGAIALGELVQAPHGEGMQSRLVLRFTDGSLYEEAVTFSQKRVFRLLTYRLIQRGPAFPEATEVGFDRAAAQPARGVTAAGHMYAFTPKPRLMRRACPATASRPSHRAPAAASR